LVHQGHVYALTDNGIAYCWRISDGKELWKERLAGPVSASPVLVQDRIYWANESGTHFVFRANPAKFEPIAKNQLGTESFASPAVAGEQMFLRVAEQINGQRKEALYCIGASR
jgi:outer membrane protein assembly factor BamB